MTTSIPGSSNPESPGRAGLQALESVTGTSLGRLDVDDLLTAVLDRVAGLLAVDTVAVLLLDQSSQQLIARAAWGIEEEVRQGVRVSVGRGFAGRIAATREPVILERVDATTVANPLLWERGIRTMLGVPLLNDGGLLGVLHVGSLSERRFTAADSDLLEQVASLVAAAIQVRQLEIERAASRVLQRGLLPSRLPEPPGIEFASRYVPSEIGGVGGDWYDAFLLPNGKLWIMVGDVVGHGMHAAIVMGRLRSTLRAYAVDGHSPDEVLVRGDRDLQLFEPEVTATVVCGVLHPPYQSIQLSLAGHPPPVLALPDAPATMIDARPDLPLGVDRTVPRASASVSLALGAVLVAYTDGLIERRNQSLDERFTLLCQAVRPAPVEDVCFRVMDALVGRDAPEDDIAVLALGRVPTGS